MRSGERHEGTGGWHVIPYVTQTGEVGYVDTARGRAYLTGVTLEPAVITALTEPDQPDGPIASGAAAWSSPDVGHGSRTEAPDGWRQLLLDIRVSVGPADDLPPREPVLVAYGLVTCYSHRRGEPPSRLPSEWGATDDQSRRIQAMAEAWLDELVERLGPTPQRGYERTSPRTHITQAIGTYRGDESVLVQATRAHAITLVADAALEYGPMAVRGTRRIDAIHRALEARIVEELEPMVVAMPGWMLDTGSWPLSIRDSIIRPAARAVADRLLGSQRAPLEREVERAHRLLRECMGVLYEAGAVVTEAGAAAGVTCSSPPPRPTSTEREIDGMPVWYVPFGADYPAAASQVLAMGVGHETRCRPEHAAALRARDMRQRVPG